MTDQFPDLVKAAAKLFTNECTAYAQFRVESGVFKARFQAVEIAKQFVGDVKFGQDPKGILFYSSLSPFKLSRVDFHYQRYKGPGKLVAIKVDFTEEGKLNAFASFVARFDTAKYTIPLNEKAGGKGRWMNFVAGTTQTTAIRVGGSNSLNLYFPPIRREVIFHTNQTSEIDATGILIFPDVKKLKDQPEKEEHDNRHLLADYAPDRIVFSLKPKGEEKLKVYGIFVPDEPLTGVGSAGINPSTTTWRDYEPVMKRSDFEGEDADEDPNN